MLTGCSRPPLPLSTRLIVATSSLKFPESLLTVSRSEGPLHTLAEKKQIKQVDDVEIATAIIAYEAESCTVARMAEASGQPQQLQSGTGGVFWGRTGEEWPRS